MPTLVWERQLASGINAVGEGSAATRRREEAVPDPVTYAAPTVPDDGATYAASVLEYPPSLIRYRILAPPFRQIAIAMAARKRSARQRRQPQLQRGGLRQRASEICLQVSESYRLGGSKPRYGGVVNIVTLVRLILPSKPLPHICS